MLHMHVYRNSLCKLCAGEVKQPILPKTLGTKANAHSFPLELFLFHDIESLPSSIMKPCGFCGLAPTADLT